MDVNLMYVLVGSLIALLVVNNLPLVADPLKSTSELFNAPKTTKSIPFSKQRRTPLQDDRVVDDAVKQGLQQMNSKGVKLKLPHFQTFQALRGATDKALRNKKQIVF